jgi:hypothetical protein
MVQKAVGGWERGREDSLRIRVEGKATGHDGEVPAGTEKCSSWTGSRGSNSEWNYSVERVKSSHMRLASYLCATRESILQFSQPSLEMFPISIPLMSHEVAAYKEGRYDLTDSS